MITLKEVLTFVAKNKPQISPNVRIYVGGGLANRGWTANDIDIFVKGTPTDSEWQEIRGLCEKLDVAFGSRLNGWEVDGEKHVTDVWDYSSRRARIYFLRLWSFIRGSGIKLVQVA